MEVITFSYWEGDPSPSVEENERHWSAISASHAIFGMQDALTQLESYSPQFVPAFKAIRIPACRSDVAMLMILYNRGGLFLDMHCGAVSKAAIIESFGALDEASVVVSTRWAPAFERVLPYNGVLWARPRSLVIKMLLDTALANLQAKYEREKAVGFEPVDIWSLTGPGVLWRCLFDPSSKEGRLRNDLPEAVLTSFEDQSPVNRYYFNTYRTVVKHWSQRQATEPLFD